MHKIDDLIELHNASKLNDFDVEKYSLLASYYLDNEKFTECFSLLSIAITKFDKNSIILNLFANYYASLDDSEKALEYLLAANDIDSNNFDILFNIGLTYGNLDNYNKALEYFLSCYALENDDYEVLYNIAQTYYYMDDNSNAKEYLNKCNKAYSLFDKSYALLGIIAEHENDYVKSLEHIKKAYSLNKDSIENKFLLFDALLHNELFDDALEIIYDLLDFEYDNRDVWVAGIELLMKLERYVEAKNMYEDAKEHFADINYELLN